MSIGQGVDLFCGVGGWHVAGDHLGIRLWGLDNNATSLLTAEKAGHLVHFADLSTLSPGDYGLRDWNGGVDIITASPPCQHFSASAPRRRVVSQTAYNIKRRTKWRAYSDQGPDLVQVPMKWVRYHGPRFVAFEQVPKVLPIWEQFAAELQTLGYHTWTGILNAADYGVPQSRKRAILIASKVGPVHQPTPILPRPAMLYPTIVCNRRSKGGIVVGRSLKQGGIPLSFAEAGAIQTMPPDYPWQGGVERKSEQIGNLIPPMLAESILSELVASQERAA